jgi:hypothetical protein
MQTPILTEPFVPCPVCRRTGTLDMITWSESVCLACGRRWNHITGKLIVFDPEKELKKWKDILADS